MKEKNLKDLAVEKIESAQGSWIGVDWSVSLCDGAITAESSGEIRAAIKSLAKEDVDLDNPWKNPDMLREALEEMEELEEEAREDAKRAEELGDEAIAAIEAGDAEAALKAIDEADSIENQYGDSPRYGPALEAVKRWAESLK